MAWFKRGWFSRWLLRFAERHARRYYEGPEPPRRLAQEVNSFAALHPRATQREWIEFARAQCEESYRSGYIRGFERNVRDLNFVDTDPLLLEAARRRELGHDTSWVDLAPSEADVQATIDNNRDMMDRLSPEERILYADQIGRNMGGFRVVLIDPRTPKAKKEQGR